MVAENTPRYMNEKKKKIITQKMGASKTDLIWRYVGIGSQG